MTFFCFAIIKTSLGMALMECYIFQLLVLHKSMALFLLAQFLMLAVLQLVVENGCMCIVGSYIKAVLKASALIFWTYFVGLFSMFGLDFHSDVLNDFLKKNLAMPLSTIFKNI